MFPKADRRNGMGLRTRLLVRGLAASAAFAGGAASADDGRLQCEPGLRIPEPPVLEAADTDADPGTIHLTADEGSAVEGGGTVLTGNVEAARGTLRLRADELVHTPADETLDARGNVRIWDEGTYVTGDRARADIPADVVTVEPATSYVLEEKRAHGDAAVLRRFGNERLSGDDVTYTTCNPGDTDWRITASRVDLDFVDESGTARGAWLRFKGVPVLYTPWMSFPLGERRRSGFLAPAFGVNSSRGAELAVPYYFNLAPNYDATLTARTMSRRGVQTQGEFRFLSRVYGSGRFLAEHLPSDRLIDDDRSMLDLEYRRRWSSRWSTNARLEWTSDAEYLDDFGTDLSQSSRTHLPRWIDTRYRGDGWNARIRFRDYLTVDREIPSRHRPYAELPQVRVRTSRPEKNRTLNFAAAAEVTYFDRRSRTTGGRMDLQPSITYPLRTTGTFVVPKATLHLTRYALDRAGTDASGDDGPSRVLPSFSIDGGVFLERPLNFRDRSFIHTIEPRLHYLRVPFEDQDDLPLFDTSLPGFSFAQLFRDNRFSGRDRIGDADQVALTLTSRLLDERGAERVRASIGQIRYFRDRRVTLDGEPEATRTSDLVAEIGLRPTRSWRLQAGLQYDTDAGRTEKNALNVRYQPDRRSVANVGYRVVRGSGPADTIEQADLSFAWPLAANWRTVGRWNFALDKDTNRTLEAFAGLEYENCCLGFRVVARRFLTGDGSDEEDDYSHGFFLQIELKGLTGAGRATGALLERSIPGFENPF